MDTQVKANPATLIVTPGFPSAGQHGGHALAGGFTSGRWST